MEVIKRTFGYYKEKPAMFIAPVGRDNKNRFIIKLDDIWKYSDTHNEQFESFIANKMLQICKLFDITVPKGTQSFAQLMVSISTVIMDGIDDLVKMPPYRAGHDDPESVIDAKYEIPGMMVGMLQ